MSCFCPMPTDLSAYVGISYFGQESIVLDHCGTRIAIDPYLTDSIDKNDPAWKRNYPTPISPAQLATELHYVFCTHDHTDHMNIPTLLEMVHANPNLKIYFPRTHMRYLLQCGLPECQLMPIDADQEYLLGTFSVTPIPAAHEELHSTADGYAELSYRFAFHTHYRDTVIFHGGDCCIYDGIEQHIGKTDVILLPVNGRDHFKRFEHNIIGNLTIREAVELAERTGAELFIPMHYDLYPRNGLTTTEIVSVMESSSLRYHLFRPGERLIYTYQGMHR